MASLTTANTTYRMFDLLSNWQAGQGVNAVIYDPVSYTHLRAHETVLDIVCRLLLAKKKTKSNHKYTHSIQKTRIY